jgi:muramoyltetrapeptide carboxypeptidase
VLRSLALGLLLTAPLTVAIPEEPAAEAATGGATGDARKPPPLKRGDTIGLLAPASPLEAEEIQAAAANLRRRGYRVKLGAGLDRKLGYLAGSDTERAKALNEALSDPELKAIVCVRGGYGSPRLLDLLDYEAMRRQPKVIIGYSDITALLLAARKEAGLVVFHGPMGKEWSAKVGLSPFSEKYFWPAFAPENPLFENWGGERPAGMKAPFTVAGGTAEGVLVGGNLSVISCLMGTPYEIETRGAILFLEEVSEKLFRIDRMLNQLRLAGKLREARGILLGAFAGCEEREGEVTRGEVLRDYFSTLGVPVLADFPAGHVPDHVTLPLGVRVRLDASAGTLTLLEAPVAEPPEAAGEH